MSQVPDLRSVVEVLTREFDAQLGAPWRWADVWMTKPYELIECATPEQIVAYFRARKDKAGYGIERRPVLYLRWEQFVRVEDGQYRCRFYLDGNPKRPVRGNPSEPRGRPTVGQVRLAA